jgi:hypothetical protein
MSDGDMGRVNGDEGRESGNQLVCVYRYMVIWSGSDIDEEAYESVNATDTSAGRASDNDVEKGSGTSDVEHLVSDFESVSDPLVDLENLGGRIYPLTSLWSSGGDHHP